VGQKGGGAGGGGGETGVGAGAGGGGVERAGEERDDGGIVRRADRAVKWV